MAGRKQVAKHLAEAFLAGVWTPGAMLRRAENALGRGLRKPLREVIDGVLDGNVTPYPRRLVDLILGSPAFEQASLPARQGAHTVRPTLRSPRFAPVLPGPHAPLPKLVTPRDLAAWLDVSLPHLEWFSDGKRQHGHAFDPSLQHYAYVWRPKKSGAARLIEAPKRRLKAIQRQILDEILNHIPAHERAHGFVRGRSCLSAARAHAGESIVATVDLKDYFLNTPLNRVQGVFRCAGYPWPVARILTGLCATSTPDAVFDDLPVSRRADWAARDRFQAPHLPQGAPTSPALANLCSWRLDSRISGLARRLDANYTRYADDLTFSGDRDFAQRIRRFLASVEAVVRDEGYALNGGKTRIMRRSGCQRVTGLVVNEHVNLPRADFDTLKATLFNCVRHGPESQNRIGHADFRAHLNGRVTWAENVNPGRGFRLRQMYERIEW
jgi:hypothetical protein